MVASCLTLLALFTAPVHSVAQDNTLVLLSDDLGVDIVTCYLEGPVVAPTPNIDSLAGAGVLFRNAWANPVCSPTRAHLQTGRHGFRTGVGVIVKKTGWALQLSETTLPEALGLYAPSPVADAYFGKWHLGNSSVGGTAAPNAAGWSHFAGTETNLYKPQTYFDWTHVENGLSTRTNEYATSRTVDDFLRWRETAPEPWVAVVAFHAPHDPLHAPPSHLHSFNLPNIDPRTDPRLFYRAMVEAMDTEIGRLLAGMGAQRANTNVIFMADNGTPRAASVSPFIPAHAKLSPYEGGVNVPLIISGPIVKKRGREVDSLVHSTDIFSTVLDLAGVDQDVLHSNEAIDGLSLVPYLKDPKQASIRRYVFSELFAPNGTWHSKEIRVLRDKRYKLIRFGLREPFAFELYDLSLDPFETNNLVSPGMSDLVQVAFRRLQTELKRLLAG
ncbi:MAG: sulfatase-like hydrolase/transferase [Planctomycetota bacterium]|jgi:arylsulfatase A-like enzyme|nr:sulfatase-like hydrolase/transferase [Planctomycetota bacterium]